MSHTVSLSDGTFVTETGSRTGFLGIICLTETEPTTDPRYKGVAGKALRYLGTRADSTLYLGAKTMWS